MDSLLGRMVLRRPYKPAGLSEIGSRHIGERLAVAVRDHESMTLYEHSTHNQMVCAGR
jgi:hypothetical protein